MECKMLKILKGFAWNSLYSKYQKEITKTKESKFIKTFNKSPIKCRCLMYLWKQKLWLILNVRRNLEKATFWIWVGTERDLGLNSYCTYNVFICIMYFSPFQVAWSGVTQQLVENNSLKQIFHWFNCHLTVNSVI